MIGTKIEKKKKKNIIIDKSSKIKLNSSSSLVNGPNEKDSKKILELIPKVKLEKK